MAPISRLHRLYYSLVALAAAVLGVSTILTSGMLYHYGLEGWAGDFLFVLFSLGSFALFEWLLALPILIFSVPQRPSMRILYLIAACSIGPIVFVGLRLATTAPYSPLAVSSPRRILFTATILSVLTAFIYKRLTQRITRPTPSLESNQT